MGQTSGEQHCLSVLLVRGNGGLTVSGRTLRSNRKFAGLFFPFLAAKQSDAKNKIFPFIHENQCLMQNRSVWEHVPSQATRMSEE